MSRLKRRIKRLLRQIADVASGRAFRWAARKASGLQGFSHYFELVQPIMPTALIENKIHNLNLAIGKLHLLQWEPHTILSFWHLVGEASEQRGYREGRNIVAGQLQRDFGGGLCQLSSILYHLALLANLKVLERHHHSVDFYQEDERFTPLGADATVVYGYKDLRLENNQSIPLVLWLQLEGMTLTARLYTHQPASPQVIVFERQYSDASVSVKALDGRGRLVGLSHYVCDQQLRSH